MQSRHPICIVEPGTLEFVDSLDVWFGLTKPAEAAKTRSVIPPLAVIGGAPADVAVNGCLWQPAQAL